MAARLLCIAILLVCTLPVAAEPLLDTHAALVAKLAAGEYSRRGADTCLGCHDESEPFPAAAVFETVHGHPGVDGSPFAAASPSSYPAGLQCEACHGPMGDHGRQLLREGAVREPMVNFRAQGNASAGLQNHFCLACHQDYGRARWAGSAHEQGDVACADCHRIHDRIDAVRTQTGQAAAVPRLSPGRAHRPVQALVPSHARASARLPGLPRPARRVPARVKRCCANSRSTRPATPVTRRSRDLFSGSTRPPVRTAGSVTCRTGPISPPCWCAGCRNCARGATRPWAIGACRPWRTGCRPTPARSSCSRTPA